MKIGFGGLGVIALVCACGGKSASSIDDTVATAQPADPCAGIVLPAVTPADLKTFDVAGSDTHCVSAGTDLLGNVFVSVYTRYVVDQSVVTSAGLTLQSFHPAASFAPASQRSMIIGTLSPTIRATPRKAQS